jgi:hypothetical protein
MEATTGTSEYRFGLAKLLFFFVIIINATSRPFLLLTYFPSSCGEQGFAEKDFSSAFEFLSKQRQ